MRLNVLVAPALLLMAGPVFAQDIVRQFCEGEQGPKCPVKPAYSCPQDTNIGAGDRAKALCTIQTPEGPRVMNYRLEVKSTEGGNKCGYTVFEVTCFRN